MQLFQRLTSGRCAMAAAAILLSTAAAQAVTFNGATIFNNDATSGISPAKTYTHALDFAQSHTAGSVVNGVNMINAGLAGPNWTFAGANTDCCANANTGIIGGGGTDSMLRDFFHNNTGGNANLTLTGLTPGQAYEARVYFRQFGPFDRTHTVVLNNGISADAVTYNPDGANEAGYLSFTYTANSPTASIDFVRNGGGSWHHYAFTNELTAAEAAPQQRQGIVLADDFTTGLAVQPQNTNDVNRNLAGRQSGHLATVAYRPSGNTQLGNTGAGDKVIHDNGNVLLAAFGGYSELGVNLNGAISAGGLSLKVDLAPDVSFTGGAGNDWAAINIGYSAGVAGGFPINQNSPHFGILFRENGLIQAFDGATNLTPVEIAYNLIGSGSDMQNVELIFSDPTDFNPFDGIGVTHIVVKVNGEEVFEFTKGGGGYLDNYINFQSSRISHFDNLVITNTTIPEPATALLALGGLAGLMMRRRRVA